jgi:hypothetical protein
LAKGSVVSLIIAYFCKIFYDIPKHLVPQQKGRPRGIGLPSAGQAGGQGHHPLDRGRDREGRIER